MSVTQQITEGDLDYVFVAALNYLDWQGIDSCSEWAEEFGLCAVEEARSINSLDFNLAALYRTYRDVTPRP